jgi:hypothetical protein
MHDQTSPGDTTHAFAVEKARIVILKKANAIQNHKNQMTLNGTKRMMHLYYYLTSVVVCQVITRDSTSIKAAGDYQIALAHN